MRIDPIEVLGSVLAITPVRLLAAWLAAGLGGFTPVVVSKGFTAFEDFGWWMVFFPFNLFFTALNSGWWALAAVPLILVMSFRMIRFLFNENAGSDLLVIFALGYFVAISAADPAWVKGFIVAMATAASAFLAAKLDRRDGSL